MKHRVFFIVCLFFGLVFVGCGEKTEPVEVQVDVEEEVPVVEDEEEVDDPVVDGAMVERIVEEVAEAHDVVELAGRLGFAASIPKEYQGYHAVDVGKFRGLFEGTSMYRETMEWVGLEEGAGEVIGIGEEGEPVVVESEWTEVMKLLTQGEVFFATGPGTAEQANLLVRFFSRYQQQEMEASFTYMAESLGLMEEDQEMEEYWFEDPFTKMLRTDPEAALVSLETAQVPTLLMGFEIKEGRDAAMELLAEMDATLSIDMPPTVIKKEIEEKDLLFIIYTFESTDMMAMEDARDIFDMLDEAQLERLHTAINTKKVSFGFGMKGDYLIYFAGPDEEALRFAESPEESVLVNPEFAFVAKYKDEDLLGVSYCEASILNAVAGLGDYSYVTQAFINVLQRSTEVGNTRDIVALVERIEANAKRLMVSRNTNFAGVMFAEEGIRFEGMGGSIEETLDSSGPLHFASLGEREGTALYYAARSADWVSPLVGETLEDIIEVASQLTERYGLTEGAIEMHSEQIEFLTTVIFPALKELHVAFGDTFLEGLGNESGLVVDLSGAMPKIPELPLEFVEEARIPRVAFTYIVEDREKLGEGWQKAEPAIARLIEAISEQVGTTFTLPDHMDTEKEGITTYMYPFTGITNNDFIPSVSLNDDLFFLSSSRTLSESIAEYLLARGEEGQEVVESLAAQWFIDFDLIQRYAGEMIDLCEKHFSEVEEEMEVDEFMMQFDGYGMGRAALRWTEDIKSYEGKVWHVEGDRLRMSWHLKLDGVQQ